MRGILKRGLCAREKGKRRQSSCLGKDEIKTRAKDDETFCSSWRPVNPCVCVCVCVGQPRYANGKSRGSRRTWRAKESSDLHRAEPNAARFTGWPRTRESHLRSWLGIQGELKPIEIYHRTNWQTKPPLIPAVYTSISVCWSYRWLSRRCNSRRLMELIVPQRGDLVLLPARWLKKKKERERAPMTDFSVVFTTPCSKLLSSIPESRT